MERQPLRPTKNLPETMSRREMLEWFGHRTLEATIFIGGFEVMYGIGKAGLAEKIGAFQETALRTIESQKSLEVRYFAREILDAGREIVGSLPHTTFLAKSTIGCFFGNVGIGLISLGQKELFSKKVGILTVNGARVVDVLSTFAFTQYMADPRFKEYGFDNFMKEQSPIMSETPTPDEIFWKNIPMQLLITGLSGFRPLLGRLYLGFVPAISENNTLGANTIKKCLDLGDDVKKLIASGVSPDKIRFFLQNEVQKAKGNQQ